MMTIAAVLLLVCFTRATNGTWCWPEYACLAAVVALSGIYLWRMNWRFTAVLTALSLGLWLYLRLSYRERETSGGSGPSALLAFALCVVVLAMCIGLVSAVFHGRNRRIGIGVGCALGLVCGRTILLPAPCLAFLSGGLTVLVAVVFPVFAGGLFGMDLGAYAERRPALWNSRRFWAAGAAAAVLLVGMRVYDVASGSYTAYAVEELNRMGNVSAIVRKVRTSPIWRQRVEALYALNGRGGIQAARAAISRLKVDPRIEVRHAASGCLQNFIFGSEQSVRQTVLAALVGALSDLDRGVRRQTVLNFELYANDFGGRVAPFVTDALVSALRDEDRLVQDQAVEALDLTGDKRVFDLLVPCLNDLKTKTPAIYALGGLKDPRALPLLFHMLSTNDSMGDVLCALEGRHDKRVLPYLMEALKSDRTYLWEDAAKQATDLGAEHEMTQLMCQHIAGLDSKAHLKLTTAQDFAMYILGDYGDESALPLLRRLAGENWNDIYLSAQLSAERLEQRIAERKHRR